MPQHLFLTKFFIDRFIGLTLCFQGTIFLGPAHVKHKLSCFDLDAESQTWEFESRGQIHAEFEPQVKKFQILHPEAKQ